MDKLMQRKASRFKCLNALYELTDGSRDDFFDAESLAEEAGLSGRDVELALEFLEGEGLVVSMGLSVPAVRLTHAGVVQVERALSHPENETTYFPAVMNITNHIESTGPLQIQQGTQGSTQTMSSTVNGDAIDAIKEVLKTFDAHLADIAMPDASRQELVADLNALRAQLDSPKPKASILAECLKSARAIVEGIASTVLSPVVLPQIATALSALT